MTDTVSAVRAITRFIATVGAGTLVGSLVALMILLATDPAPAVLHVAKSGFFLLLAYSAPFVTAGLFLFGLPVDWALRMRGYYQGGVYGAAGALGGGVFAFLIAYSFEGSGWPQRAYTFMMIGAAYGLSTAMSFWLIFRRGQAPAD
ncbi:MAG TPA: hypothetical protein VIT38_12170 [Allosphingosinicella sp.]